VDLHVSLIGRRGLSEQIYRQIGEQIDDGRLAPGQRLPSSRGLADRLSVSRNTVSTAYDRLVADGLLDARAGLGVFVGEVADAGGDRVVRTAVDSAPVSQPMAQPLWETIGTPADLSAIHSHFDVRAGLPSLQHFPYSTWRAMVSRQLRPTAARSDLYAEPAGSSRLRSAIARHISVSRGVRATEADTFVTNGFQQAIDLIGRVLLAPGDLVAVEDPGYRPAAMLFRSQRAGVVGVPVDAEGIVVDRIPVACRLVYVTPSHQFPVGMSMSLARRRQLLDWSDRTGAVIVEDDYDSEFRYAGRPVEPLQSMDGSWRVLYVGSFSKTMLPSLRLGFVIAPPSLLPALRKAKVVSDWQTAGPMQDALAQFIGEGRYAKHLGRMRRIYQVRHQLIASLIDSEFGDLLDRIPSMAGLHIAADLVPGTGCTDEEIARRARSRGVELGQPMSYFAVTEPPRPGLILGYGAIGPADIPEALRRLRHCFD